MLSIGIIAYGYAALRCSNRPMLHFTRTSITCLALVTGTLSTAGATPVFNETVIHDTTTSVEVDLTAATVLCSSADYGALFLKILIPELAGLTLLDHQNLGAGAPCVSAGACQPGRMPEDIIDAATPTEVVDINVKAVRIDEADADAQTCTTHLSERVHVTIRGFQFSHERMAPLGSRSYADCVTSAPDVGEDGPADDGLPADDDQPADDPGLAEPAPHAGGCAATRGGAGSSLAVVMLGAVAALCRRKRR